MRETPNTEKILAACAAITSHVSKENPFNLNELDLTQIAAAQTLLAQKAEDQRLGALLQAQKVRGKDAALRDAGTLLARLTKVALSSTATEAQLASIGMARPAKPSRPTAIAAPSGLVATPLLPSRAVLSWDRNAAYGATQEVFWSPDGLDYRFLRSTTKSRLEVDAPAGVAAWYQVRSVRSGLVSAFSNEASVYAPSPARAAKAGEAPSEESRADLRVEKGGKAA